MTVAGLLRAEAWVDHTRDVQSGFKDVSNLSARAGRARTQYVDSGGEDFLREYQSAVSQLRSVLHRTRGLVTNNPERRKEWDEVEQITERRLGLLQTSVELKQSGAREPETQARLRQQIIEASDEADALLQKMLNQEQQLLGDRQRESDRMFRITVYILVADFFVALALFLIHYRLLNTELSAREHAEEALRRLSVRLLELQDQERRKFSRELHDSLGQYLVGVKMNLTLLGNSQPPNPLVAESMKLLDEAMNETRTISHLLHPPLLDETGFASAARWYVEGFAKRSGIETTLDLPENTGRLPSPLEIALFRVLQESLTNVHRHSRSHKAEVSVRLTPSQVVLRVRDYGKGIPARVLSRFQHSRPHGGVGLASMRERVHELGGTLEMTSDSRGTQVVATLPRSERKSQETFAAD